MINSDPLDSLSPKPKSGSEPFHGGSGNLDFTLADFWRWSTSDLTNNAMRGILAEFLVMRALGIKSEVRMEWDAYDLMTADGMRIEVKSSAYVQTWKQTRPSKPCFSIGVRRAWFSETNTYAETACRSADVYVFALLHHKDKRTVDPMDVEQWTFYVLPTVALNERFPVSKTVGLSSLMAAGALAAGYGELADAVRSCWGGSGALRAKLER